MKHFFLLLFGMMTLVAYTQVPDYVPTEGLVAWWPMNGNVDDAIGSLDGFNQGGVETEGPYGQIGQALELPSGDDFIDLPTGGVNEEGGITLAFWAWLELPIEGSAPLIDRMEVSNNLWSFSYHHSSETVHFMTRNDDGTGYHNLSTWSPPAAEWVHVTSVYRAPSGLKELHVNGSLVSEELAPLDGFTMPTMRLGEVAEGTWNSNCRFSKIGIWERALIDEEILALYNAQLPVLGCTDSIACNFNADANIEDDSCVYALFGEDCETGSAACGEGTIWDVSLQACVGFNDCPSDLDGDGLIGVEDLLSLLSDFGTDCVASDDPESTEWTCGDPVNYHGYDYATVQIGEQCWFAENLRTEYYQNGDEIPSVEAAAQWSSLISGARRIYGLGDANCGVEGDTIGYCGQTAESVFALNGYLYNWHTVIDSRGICPGNWHVPNDVALEVLLDEVGNDDQGAISSLKSEEGWSEGNGGSNASGFNALGSGYGGNLGNFSSDGHFTGFWSADETGPSDASHLHLDERPYSSFEGTVFINTNNKRYALSIRCIKD